MPRRDGTGPMGAGAMTGRKLGVCTGVNEPVYGRGLERGCGRGLGRGIGRGMGPGFGRGFGRGMGPGFGRGLGFGANANYGYNQTVSKEDLQAQREQLKTALDAIDQRLENL